MSQDNQLPPNTTSAPPPEQQATETPPERSAPLSARRAAMDLDGYDAPSPETPVGESATIPVSAVGTAPQRLPESPLPPRAADGTFTSPGHSPHVVEMARQLGFSQDDIDAATPVELLREVKRGQRQIITEHQARQTTQPPTVTNVPVAEDKPWQFNWGKDPETGNPLSDKDWGALGEPIKLLVDELTSLRTEVADLKKDHGALKSDHTRRVAATNKQKFDAFFKAHSDIFGTESHEDLDPKSDRYELRSNFLETTQKYYRGSVEQALEKAFRILYGSRPAVPAAPASPPPAAAAGDPDMERRIRQWETQGIPVGGARKPGELPPGREKAIATLENLRREHGMNEETQDFSGHFLPAK